MSSTMRAVLPRAGLPGASKNLYIGETDKPVPKEGEVLVKVKAFGVNRLDLIQASGNYPVPPGVSTVLGVEFSGIVEGSHGKLFKENDEVFGLAFGGAYAEYIAVDEGMVTKKPEALSWVKAAAIPENWLTAWQALYFIADTQPGQSVLIHAGASGVGLAAIQLAKTFGAGLIIATAGTDEKVKFVETHGAKGINYKTQDFSKEVLALTNNVGVNVVIDFVGQSYWEKNLNSMAKDGRMVLLGLMSGAFTEKPLDMRPILLKRLRIEGTTLRSRTLEYQSNLLKSFSEKALDKLYTHADGGEGLDIVIHKVYDWENVIDAHEEMAEARNIGKIICEIK